MIKTLAAKANLHAQQHKNNKTLGRKGIPAGMPTKARRWRQKGREFQSFDAMAEKAITTYLISESGSTQRRTFENDHSGQVSSLGNR